MASNYYDKFSQSEFSSAIRQFLKMVRTAKVFLLGVLALLSCINSISGNSVRNHLSVYHPWNISRVNQFSTEFYQNLSEHHQGNLVTSPLSVDLALAMIVYGTADESRAELEFAMHLPTTQTEGQDGFKSLINSVNSAAGVEIGIASKLYINKGFSIRPTFQTTLSTYFQSEIKSLDMSQANAADTINSWVAEKTNDRIKKAMSSNDLREAELVIVNAFYFRGIWINGFNRHVTILRPFHDVSANKIVQVPTMYSSPLYVNYYTFDSMDATAVELPYRIDSRSINSSCSMFIFRPNRIDGLATIERNLHTVKFNELKENNTREVKIRLPKFSVTSDLNLKPVLQKMGIRDIFESTADFNYLSEQALKLSTIQQKATILVDEDGSEAAAASTLTLTSLMQRRSIGFNVNRPFLGAIVLKSTGTPIFYVRVTMPRTDESPLTDFNINNHVVSDGYSDD